MNATAWKLALCVALGVATAASAQTDAQKKKIDGAMETIRKIASDPAVVKAIAAQNAKGISLAKIKKADSDWTQASGVTDFMKELMDNECAAALKKYKAELPAMAESFAMDNQGALVCTLKKTSDYWQGDEDKWQKSFARGKGADFVDKAVFDESSQAYSVQVSVPVKDGAKVVGALTVGLSLEQL